MRLKNIITKLAILTISLCSAYLLISTQTYVIFFDTQFFSRQFQQLQTTDIHPDAHEEAHILMDYWHSNEQFVPSDRYTMAEKEHLYDIKQLLQQVYLSRYIVSGYILVAITLLYRYRQRIHIPHIIHTTAVITAITLWCITLLGYLQREQLFEQFHHIFFVDNRTFPADSYLIQLYPESFFQNAAMMIAQRVILSIVLVYFIFFIWNTYVQKK